MRRELNRCDDALNHEPIGSVGFQNEFVAQEAEINARWQRQDDEGKRHDDEQQRELTVSIEILPVHARRIRFQLISTGTNGNEDNVHIADQHDGKWTQIVQS